MACRTSSGSPWTSPSRSAFIASVDSGSRARPEKFRFPSHGEPHQVEVEAAGVRIGFSSARVGSELFGIPTTPGENTELVLWCDDVDDLYRTALDSGGAPANGPADSPDGRLRYAWLRDPEGHRVKLVQKRG